MTNLTNLSANSKNHEPSLSSNLQFLTSGISSVVVSIAQIMEKDRITDEHYDQMCMIIMALQRSIEHIKFDWPDLYKDTSSKQGDLL